jgi:hypothetical protein
MIKVILPLPYYKSKGKALMSVNVYRNAHYHTLSRFKREYGEICSEAMSDYDLSKFSSLKVVYVMNTTPTKQNKPKKVDMVNILSMIDKVLMDILVKDGWIDDDSIKYVRDVRFKSNPYSTENNIEVILEEAKELA